MLYALSCVVCVYVLCYINTSFQCFTRRQTERVREPATDFMRWRATFERASVRALRPHWARGRDATEMVCVCVCVMCAVPDDSV